MHAKRRWGSPGGAGGRPSRLQRRRALQQRPGRGRRVRPPQLGGGSGQSQGAVMQLTDVLLEVKVPAEAFAAGGAGEGLLVVVGVHVEGQIVHLMKSLVADIALELLLPAVSQLVVFVIAWECEKKGKWTWISKTDNEKTKRNKKTTRTLSHHQSSVFR